MLMKKMLAIILVSLVLSGCEKNGSQNDLIINNTEEENVVMDENDDYELKNILANYKGIILQDDIKNSIYPMAINAEGKDEVFVGRIRRDYSVKSGINIWVVADNIRKGAATNAVQILEELLKNRDDI